MSYGPVGWGCRIHWLHLCRRVSLPHWVSYGPVGWGCRIHRLLLCRGVRLPNECLGYDTKQSDGEVPIMLWGMQSTFSLPSLPAPLWPRVVTPDKVLSMDQIELNCVLMLNWSAWNRTVLTFNCVLTKTIIILDWVVWIRTV